MSVPQANTQVPTLTTLSQTQASNTPTTCFQFSQETWLGSWVLEVLNAESRRRNLLLFVGLPFFLPPYLSVPSFLTIFFVKKPPIKHDTFIHFIVVLCCCSPLNLITTHHRSVSHDRTHFQSLFRGCWLVHFSHWGPVFLFVKLFRDLKVSTWIVIQIEESFYFLTNMNYLILTLLWPPLRRFISSHIFQWCVKTFFKNSGPKRSTLQVL